MVSVNTNVAAITALRTLQSTNAELDATQNRISTGLKIGEAKDNAAYWAISTSLQSDNKSLETVKDALGLGAATVDTAYQGLNSAKQRLDEIRQKLVSATTPGLDRTKIQDEISQLQEQLKSIAGSSIFSGENWLSINSDTANLDKKVVASFSRDANNSITIGTIGVNIGEIALFDTGAGEGIVDARATLTYDDVALTDGGFAAAADPAVDALGFGAPLDGTPASSGGVAVANLGELDLAAMKEGDRVNFALTVDGVAGNVSLATAGLTADNFAARMQAAVNTAIGAGKATVELDAATNEVKISTVSTGSTAAITVGAPAAANGDGIVTSTAGFNSASSLPTYGQAEAASVTAGAYGASVVANGDSVSFKFQVDGEVYQAEVDYAGPLADQDAFVAALNTAIDAATSITGGTPLGINKVTASVEGGNIVFTTDVAGADKSIGVFDVVESTSDAGQGLMASAGTDSGTSTSAVFAAGIFTNAGVRPGDEITFTMNVNGTSAPQTITVSTLGMSGDPADLATDRDLFASNLQAALDAAFTGAQAVNVSIDPTTNAISLTTVETGADKFIAISGVQATDGDGLTTSPLGLSDVAVQNGTPGAPGSAARVTSGEAFDGPQTIGENDTISFTVTLDGGDAETVTINRSLVEGVTGSGTIATAEQYADVLNAAIAANSDLAGKVVASQNSDLITLTKQSNAGAGTIAVGAATSSAGGDTISVGEIDITNARFTSASAADQEKILSAYIEIVSQAIESVTGAASNLGAVASRIELQQSFVNNLMDTIDKGVGGLIDADMSEESTRLQALQVKQQLGVQSLSIANQSAQNVLRLFQ